MQTRLYLALALSGLPLGAMYALQAMGIVLIYKTARVFNFAQGAIGMTCAFVASGLVVDNHLPIAVAVPMAVLFGAALGIGIERLTIRPLPPGLPRTMMTLGWLLLLQGGVGVFFGTAAGRSPARPFSQAPAFSYSPLELAYTWDQVAVLIAVVVVAVALAVFFSRTSVGVAMRSVAEDAQAARLLGIPVDLVSSLAWALGGAIAGLSGILVTPLLGTLDSTTLIVFTLQALAAAVVGGLTSLPLTLAGGLLLGLLQPVISEATGRPPGMNELVAFGVILAALALRRRGGRVDSRDRGLEPTPVRSVVSGYGRLAAAGAVVAVAIALPLVSGPQWNFNLAQTAAWSLAVLSIVMLTGVVGQVSLCQAVFMGCGAYGCAIATSQGVPFVLSVLLAGIFAAVVGAIVAVPALRLRPLELAIVTLSLAFTADRFLYSWPPLVSPNQIRVVEVPAWLQQPRVYSWACIAVLIAGAVVVTAVRHGRTGAALTALRTSEPATEAMGFSVLASKLRGFATSGFIAGIAGALYAGLTHVASSGPFDTTRSILLLAFAMIAGVASVPGAILGGVIVTLTTVSFGASNAVTTGADAAGVTALTGLIFMGILRIAPQGLSGLAGRGLQLYRDAAPAEPVPAALPVST
ncbi:MAG TPA: ABC transporter permease [Candidatus Solibacter sp.]|nr:ABC transporter permease [Candidatus Solibacter sp.]